VSGSPRRIAIVGQTDDRIARHLLQVASASGVSASILPLDGSVPIAFDGEAWLVAGEELSAFSGFFLRSYPAPAARSFADEAQVRGQEIAEAMRQQLERSHLALSSLLDLERQGRRFVNPPSVVAGLDYKPLQLATFQAMGVPYPRTLITNFPPAVRAFEADVGAVVAKPVAGGAEARLLGSVSDAALATIAHSPTIFQERVEGADIRVTVVGQEILSAVEIASETLDYRSGEAYRAGLAEYRPHALPAEIADLCRRITAGLGLVLAGIDLKLNPRQEYVVLEANSGPVYLDIEMKTGAPITAAIVRALSEGQP
jgi:glutathione synthase/RimK-type ligase-like ATP-grasp enzyme